jgi:hypothetical protein
LPTYQRQYSGDRYPSAVEQQHSIRSEKYRYQPREPVTQQHYQMQRRSDEPQDKGRGNKREERGQDRRP